MILTIDDDFDLDRIAESGQCFRWEKCGTGRYRILSGADCLYVESLGQGRYHFLCNESEFDLIWQEYFDLSENYRGIRSRIDRKQDPFLWAASEQEKGIRILRQDPWETLITFILSQNRNIPAIRRSVEMLSQACGVKKTDVLGNDYHAFPSPSALAGLGEEALKSCRLGYRCKYVQAAADAVASGCLDLIGLKDVGDANAIESLTKLYGVGIKVASCVSLFGLHHMNAFPRDVWINRILAEQYAGGYPYERYTPYNGVYQQYMFAYYRSIMRPSSAS